MTAGKTYHTTQEYARAAGLSIRQVTRMLRSGRISGEKVDKRWQIPVNGDKPASLEEAPAAAHFTVDEFAAMTYLTPWGVVDWLKTGRLKRVVDADGNWTVDAGCLEHPDIKRLLR